MATAVYHGQDLIENIFASSPDHFALYGVYTCRFYVEGEWVEVITDTTIPCVRNEDTGDLSPAYGTSINPNEMWISLAEKAYAKAVGSYEGIQKVKIHEALLHLTGGSVQNLSLRDASNKDLNMAGGTWKMLNKNLKNDIMVLMIPAEKSATDAAGGGAGEEETGDHDGEESRAEDSFLQNRIYSVIACRDIGGFELILLHNPWAASPNCWKGSWSDDSTDWDLYPEICQELEDDPTLPWTRRRPNGYFWMSGKMVNKYFNSVYLCKLFPHDKFSFYCVRGNWTGKTSGGALQTVRDKTVVAREAAASRQYAFQRVRPCSIASTYFLSTF